MRALVTGANGFLGKNLRAHLRDKKIETVLFTREMSEEQLSVCLESADFVFHLAGINRPENPDEFLKGNKELTVLLGLFQVVFSIDPGISKTSKLFNFP